MQHSTASAGVLWWMAALAAAPVAAAPMAVTMQTGDTAARIEVRDNSLVLAALGLPGGSNWVPATRGTRPLAIPFINSAAIGAQRVPLVWRYAGLHEDKGAPRRAVFTFTCNAPRLELQAAWQAWPGPGPVEEQLTITNRGAAQLLLPLPTTLTFAAADPAGHTLEHWWVEKGAGAPSAQGTHRTPIGANYATSLLSRPYSEDNARDAIPWTLVHDPVALQGWYTGIEFSGRVRLDLASNNAPQPVLNVSLGLDNTATTGEPPLTRLGPGETFTAPTVFVGCYRGGVDDGCNRLHRWVENHLRPPVHDARYPLLVNNSWGSGMAVDDKLTRQMIDDAAALGLEMFHIDAGWFRGVGDWHPNPAKFPNGLAPIADYAHQRGLKFGLWVGWTQGGAQRDGLSHGSILSVFDPAMTPWFTHDYAADWHPADFTGADVCLGDPDAVRWCANELDRIVRDYKLDMLEHDQRMVVEHCDHATHLHTAAASNVAYRAARGYEQVYDTVRAYHPDLLFEDCVNGGRMVDYGVVRRVHYISITDTYDPLSNRRAFYDASYALPPSMCECYIANHPGNSLANFKAMLRSGMMGWCTIMLDMAAWTPQQRAAAQRQFAVYKTLLRPLIAHGDLYHVTDRPDGVRWDGMQYYDAATGQGVVFAFRGTTTDADYTFHLQGLEPNALYSVAFEDGTHPAFTARGDALMTAGMTVHLGEPQGSELVYVRRQTAGR